MVLYFFMKYRYMYYFAVFGSFSKKMFVAPLMLRSPIFRQSWPNVLGRKVRFHFFTLNLNNNSPSPLLNVVWDYFLLGISITQSHLLMLVSTLKRGPGGVNFFAKSVKILQLARLYVLISLRSTNFWPWLSESVSIFKLCFYLVKKQEKAFM